MRGRLFSYVGKRYEDGAFSGVPRFDFEIRSVFPSVRSVTHVPSDLDPEDVVITDNHWSMNVPQVVRTIGVHHGCAAAHFERDPGWQNPTTRKMVADQVGMFSYRNRYWVAPSVWARDEFTKRNSFPAGYSAVIPHWAKRFGPAPKRSRQRPVVIGDWRDTNKGSDVFPILQKRLPQFEFRQLNFKPAAREPFYLDADLYLCLSVSDGAPYSVADAEACELPIVTTNVGWATEFKSSTVIQWLERGNIDVVGQAILERLSKGRTEKSFFEDWTFERWRDTWVGAVEAVSRVERDVAVKIFPVFSPVAPPKVEVKPKPVVIPAQTVQPPPPPIRGLRVLVGLAGGVGNSIFNLPMLKALRAAGHIPIGYVETDYPSASLWARCRYLEEVVEAPDQLPLAEVMVAGPWCPRLMSPHRSTRRYIYPPGGTYKIPEWKLILKAAEDLGWSGERPDVSDWCTNLDPSLKYDVGIAPGCKPGSLWERKQYPHMGKVAERLLEMGLKVCVFGTERDPKVPGDDYRGRFRLADLPEGLAACGVILGVDGGVSQLAASLGIPSVILYTATSEVKGDPVCGGVSKLITDVKCRPCQSTPAWNACKNWICQDINPADVVSEVTRRLNR